jgi:hypothetical protein
MKICLIDNDDCTPNSKSLTRGWCPTHYSRWRRNGDPLVTRYPGWPRNLLGRLRFCPPSTLSTGCIEFTGFTDRRGYGRVTRKGEQMVAHRASYELVRGPIPAGLDLDHLCRHTSCVHPGHLEPVTRKENARRGLQGVLKTHCVHGHEYTPENTYIDPSGGRRCRQCHREEMRKR